VRVAVISDLHSNREALDAVFARIDELGVERVFCLGDVVGYGPEPEYCTDLVRRRCEVTLMGNHDEALFHEAVDFNAHARGAIDHTRRRMKPGWISGGEKRARWRWLQGLRISHDEGRFHFVHGSPRDPIREYVLSTDGFLNPEKLRAIFDCFDGVAVAGHTHHPGMHDESLAFHGLDGGESCRMELPARGKAFVNVGSVGQPRDGDNRACFAVLEDDAVTWYRVPYDFAATQRKIRETGELSEILATRLALGK
jgi:diadenosine tetraphosphatase ApaH/serine/threonine PP2A family protein phosphatase